MNNDLFLRSKVTVAVRKARIAFCITGVVFAIASLLALRFPSDASIETRITSVAMCLITGFLWIAPTTRMNPRRCLYLLVAGNTVGLCLLQQNHHDMWTMIYAKVVELNKQPVFNYDVFGAYLSAVLRSACFLDFAFAGLWVLNIFAIISFAQSEGIKNANPPDTSVAK